MSFSIADIGSHCAKMEAKIENDLDSYDAQFEALRRLSKLLQKSLYKDTLQVWHVINREIGDGSISKCPSISRWKGQAQKQWLCERKLYNRRRHNIHCFTGSSAKGHTFLLSDGLGAGNICDHHADQANRFVGLVVIDAEGDVEKASAYWPTEKTDVVFGDFTIKQSRNTTRDKDVLSRNLELAKTEEKGRAVTHIQYVAWPDFGVPKFDSFHHFVERCIPLLKTALPIIHCSAGCGRTGVFIAIMQILLNMEKDIDILQVVYELRKQRAGMIQTRDQYAFIFNYLKYRQGLSDKK